MKLVPAAVVLLLGVLGLGGCAVYEPYPVYAAPVMVGPPVVYGPVGVYRGRDPGWRHHHHHHRGYYR